MDTYRKFVRGRPVLASVLIAVLVIGVTFTEPYRTAAGYGVAIVELVTEGSAPAQAPWYKRAWRSTVDTVIFWN